MWTSPDGKITRLMGCLALVFSGLQASAQQPAIHLVHPYRPVVETPRPVNYVSGHTCKGCRLTMNGTPVKVYPTGGFACEVTMTTADSTLVFRTTAPSGAAATKRLTFHYRPATPPQAETAFRISSVTTYPSGNCWLLPGDAVRFRVKAQPANQVTLNNRIPLYEQPATGEGDIAGIYQVTHIVTPGDEMLQHPCVITLKNPRGETASYTLSPQIRVLDPSEPLTGKTVGPIAYLEFGRGNDRLGGAKIGYIDTAVLLHITGRFDDVYRVSLAPGHTAYIPMGQVLLLPKGAFPPESLTGSCRIWGDGNFDYVSLGLAEKLPYTLTQQTDPARLVLTVYGATSNTNWINQLSSARVVRKVSYEQVSDGVFRVYIALNSQLIWGYQAAYEGTTLRVRIKRPPHPLTLGHLTVAIDAGHGGSNRGAQGPTGIFEKTVTLQLARRLEAQLKKAGCRVIMTRDADVSLDMTQRTLLLRKADPDLLISLHLNASADPVHVSGTSTLYRYPGFKPLSRAILHHMVALGLAEYGNIGSFNFALNGPTAYPNTLVETVFLSNPADETKVLNPAFQERIAGAVVAGIRDFLKQAATPASHP